ncbi:hypothetical protein CI109_102044 [Kwoniella shandongensis]|uniref:Uncharacterized protein n=1 Tax=Kwoniella shandongensis TaxID=1734106 RepID=A0A5M6BRR2_9TREE|nr:uncharacterized protein CI109_007377 [Kwoniella shandongensis]KAA5524285.1 hypothetical protein CI109_007377 [Kwoniella shandongensis]
MNTVTKLTTRNVTASKRAGYGSRLLFSSISRPSIAFRTQLCPLRFNSTLPPTQRAAIIRKQTGPIEFTEDYPVPKLGYNEVLAKVLYTGVCQSDLHTKNGTAAGGDGKNITAIKLPHIGGHEGVGRILAVGEGVKGDVRIGGLVGIRFISRICRRCEYCLAGQEQHCIGGMTNHLHHEDGAFQEYIALDGDNLTLLPDDVDPVEIGPILCAGITAYKCVQNCNIKPGEWLVVIGAGGGMGHLAVQYARVVGARVIAIDGGDHKRHFCLSLGAEQYIDFKTVPSIVDEVQRITKGGAHAVVCAAGSPRAYARAADMLRIGGTLACGGIPPGTPHLETSIGTIVIKGLKIVGSLVGSLKDTMQVVELTRLGRVKPAIEVRPWKDLPKVYDELERDAILGRVVLKIAEDE